MPTDSTAETTADPEESKYRRSRRWNVVLLAVVAFLALVVAAQALQGGESSSWDPPESAASGDEKGGAQEMDFVRRDADDPMAIGDVDAPVVLSEWVDMRCPYCALFSRDTLPELVEEYVDSGKVRIEFHDVSFFGKKSEDAAVAARAAGEQDKYVEFVEAVYDAAPEGGHPDLPRDTLVDFAEKAGVSDIEQFTNDLDDPELRSDVQESTQSAQSLGVTAVPFFVVGNTPLSGAQPMESFHDLIDPALPEEK